MIDWNQVIELQEGVGPDDVLPVIDLVLAQIESHLLALESRPLHLADDLRLLSNLGANIGLSDFCAHCHRSQQQLAMGSQMGLGVAALRACFGHTKQLFLRDLPHVIDQFLPGKGPARAS